MIMLVIPSVIVNIWPDHRPSLIYPSSPPASKPPPKKKKNSSANNVYGVINDNINPYRNMVLDAMRMNQGNVSQCLIVEEESNANAAMFFDLLKDSDEPLCDGCTNHCKLLVVA